MKIALINGSPKFKENASGKLLDLVKEAAGAAGLDTTDCRDMSNFVEIQFRKPQPPTAEQLAQLAEADAWVFAFPLYVDGIPGHLLHVLTELEAARASAGLSNPQRKIYGICNCGFYEGQQNEPALDVLKNWTAKCGYIWGGGVGVGGGGATISLTGMGKVGHFFMGPINKALSKQAAAIGNGQTLANQYVSIALPRWIYTFCAHDGWKKKIKANGGKVEDLERRL